MNRSARDPDRRGGHPQQEEASTPAPAPEGSTGSFRPRPEAPGQGTGPVIPGLPAELVDHPRYQILEFLGAGGMGTVYRAHHRFMDRTVALKVISPHLVDRPEMVGRFRREVRAAAHLSHRNIVTA